MQIKWEGCGKKKSQPVIGYYPSIFLEELKTPSVRATKLETFTV
jgi:hypothetical protein